MRTFSVDSFTPTAAADAATIAAQGFMALQGGSGTQRTNIDEVFIGGQANSTAVAIMVLARDSTVGITPTALTTGEHDSADDPAAAALAAPVLAFTQATTRPQRSNAVRLANLTLNCFGGIVRWIAGPRQSNMGIVGNTQPFGEASLSAFTGGAPGPIGAHIKYETV